MSGPWSAKPPYLPLPARSKEIRDPSDAHNEGVPVEMIMINGRWKSDCFRVYLHLRASAVQAVFERALAGGALTAHERLEESHW